MTARFSRATLTVGETRVQTAICAMQIPAITIAASARLLEGPFGMGANPEDDHRAR
jgi:hypothetical protein